MAYLTNDSLTESLVQQYCRDKQPYQIHNG